MLTSTQVFAIVGRIAKDTRLTPAAETELRLWASRWLSKFTSDREFTYRAVETMTRNAALHHRDRIANSQVFEPSRYPKGVDHAN